MPVGINAGAFAGFVQLLNLLRSEIPTDGTQVFLELLFRARAMMTLDTVGLCSSQLSAIWETDLPVSLAMASIASIDFEEIFVFDLRALRGGLVETADLGQGLPRRILPVRRPQPRGLQMSAPTFSGDAERHQFPLVFAADRANSKPDAQRNAPSHNGPILREIS